jgi:broad specificity phosphatase PhoE
MTLYLISLPQSKIERRGRISGWSRLRLDRDTARHLVALAAMLRGRTISKVYGADLHGDAVRIVADELKVPYKALRNLRGFNLGRNSGRKTEEVDAVLETMVRRWVDSSIIPIAEGDSLVSYSRRFLRTVENIMSDKQDVIIVLHPREIAVVRASLKKETVQEKLASVNHVQYGKIFIVRIEEKELGAASPVQSGTERSSALV